MTAEESVGTTVDRPRRRLRSARLWQRVATVVVAVLGGVVGVLLVPATTAQVGPLTTSVHLTPSLASDTVILLPPIGEVHFDTHTAPVRIEARVQGVDAAAAEQLVTSSGGLQELARTAPEDPTRAAAITALLVTVFTAIDRSDRAVESCLA